MTRLEQLEARRAQLAEKAKRLNLEIQRAKAFASKLERKQDTRRKILLGAILIGMVQRGEWTKEKLQAFVDKHLERDDDRALFGLAPRPTEAAGRPEASAPQAAAITAGALR